MKEQISSGAIKSAELYKVTLDSSDSVEDIFCLGFLSATITVSESTNSTLEVRVTNAVDISGDENILTDSDDSNPYTEANVTRTLTIAGINKLQVKSIGTGGCTLYITLVK